MKTSVNILIEPNDDLCVSKMYLKNDVFVITNFKLTLISGHKDYFEINCKCHINLHLYSAAVHRSDDSVDTSLTLRVISLWLCRKDR